MGPNKNYFFVKLCEHPGEKCNLTDTTFVQNVKNIKPHQKKQQIPISILDLVTDPWRIPKYIRRIKEDFFYLIGRMPKSSLLISPH